MFDRERNGKVNWMVRSSSEFTVAERRRKLSLPLPKRRALIDGESKRSYEIS